MAAATEFERLLVRLTGDGTEFQRMLAQAQSSSTAAAAAIGRSAGIMSERTGLALQAAGRSMQNVGRSLLTYVSLPIAAVGGLSVRAFAGFDQAMTESSSIMGNLPVEQLEQMRQTALSLSGQVIHSPQELGRAFYFLASAGYDAERAMAVLPAVSQFATAGAFNLERAVEFLTSAVGALGLRGGTAQEGLVNTQRVMDVLTEAANRSMASVQQFAEALANDAGAAARQSGKDVEEIVAALAVFADQGTRGLEAGSQLARGIRLIGTAAVEKAAAHRRLNFRVFDTAGNMRNLADIVDDLTRIMEPLSSQQRIATLDMLGFEALTQRAIVPLIGMGGALRDYERGLRAAGGATRDVAEKQMASFTNQMKVLWNRITVVAIELGQMLAPMIMAISGYIGTAIERWKGLNSATKLAIGWAVMVAAALGPVLISLGIMTKLFGMLLPNLMLFGKLGLVFGIVAGIIGFLAYQMGGFGALWEWIAEKAGMAWDWIKTTAAQALEFLQPVFKGIAIAAAFWFVVLAVAWKAAVAVITVAADALGSVFGWLFDLFRTNQDAALTFVGVKIGDIAVVLALIGAYKGLVLTLGVVNAVLGALYIRQLAGAILWGAWLSVVIAAKAVVLAFQGVLILWSALFAFFHGLLAAGAAVSGLWSIGSLVAAAATWVWNAALAIMNALLGAGVLLATLATIILIGAAVAVVAALIWGLVQATKAVFTALMSLPTTTGPLAAIGSMFGEWIGIMKEVIRVAQFDMPLAWRLLQAGFRLAIEQVKALWPPLWEYIKKGFSAAWELVGTVLFEEFKRALANMLNELIQFANRPLLKILFPALWYVPFDALQAETDRMNRAVDVAIAGAQRLFRTRMLAAGIKFGAADLNPQAVQDARAELEGIRGEISDLELWNILWGPIDDDVAAVARTMPNIVPPVRQMSEDMASAQKSMQALNVEAALFGSKEALKHLAEYQLQFDAPRSELAAGGGQGGQAAQQDQADLLRQIRDGINVIAGNEGQEAARFEG